MSSDPIRTLVPATVLALLLAVPATASDLELPGIDFEFYTLDNGLEVILHQDHDTPIVGVNIWYHVGSKNERPGRSGFAHLFEHMMFQGSAHQDDEFINTIQGMGGLINGSTSEDRTNYWQVVPANQLERVLLLEADRMGWLLPAMTEEKLANQKEVVRNEQRESEGRPYSKFWLDFNELFYPKGHPYDHSVIGIHEDLENATLEDVKDFFRTYYIPNNATLSIAGDFDPEQAKQWVEKYFGPIPPGDPVDEVSVWIPEMTHEKRVSMRDRVELTRLYWAWHTPPYYHDGDADIDFAATILGGGRTSRLYRRLVHEEKLAQDVRMRQESQQVASVATLQVTLRDGVDPAVVEAAVQEELDRFAKGGPTDKELTQARNRYEAGFVKGVQRIGSWGGINDRLNRYNHYVGTPDYFEEDYRRYMSRTKDTVREQFARWIGPGRMVITISPDGKPVAAAEGAVDRTTLPVAGPTPTFEVPDIHRRTLDDGLEMAVLSRDDLPLVSLRLVLHSGTSAEPAELEGLATMTGDLHLEGTKKRDKFELRSALENLGTDLEVSVGTDRSVFRMTSLSNRLDESLGLLAETVLQPAFPAENFEDLQRRKLLDLRQSSENPRFVSSRVARRVIYGEGHPYARTGTGTEATLGALTLDDVRDFSSRHYVPGNATLVVVGDVSLDELEAAWNRHFGGWTGGAPERPDLPAPPLPESRTIWLVDKPGDTQSTIAMGHPTISRSSDAWERLVVANRVLGGSFSSRVNLNLREDKGWTYGARSRIDPAVGPGMFTAGGRIQRDYTDESLLEFFSELEGLAKGTAPITPDELQFAKDALVLGYPQDFETNGELAGALADQAVYGLPDDDFARYPERIAAVDRDMANATARELLHPDHMHVVIVGDLEKIEEPLRALDLDAEIRYADREGRPLTDGPEVSVR
jgi:zinc protease